MRPSRVLPFLFGVVSLVGCGGATITPPPATDGAAPDAAGDVAAAPDVAAPDVPVAPDAAAPDVPVAPDVTLTDAAPVDVTPVDVTPPDDAAPGPCGQATALTRDLVGAAQVARVAGGVVVAWHPYGGGDVVVQGFSDALAPQGSPLALSLLTNGVDGISLSFEGAAGVMGAGSSLYLLSLDARLGLTLTRRVDFPRRLVRHAHMASATLAHAVLAGGEYVFASATGTSENTPNAPFSPPHGAGVSIAPTLGGYVSVEPRDTAGGRRLHMRRFIFGHGASIEVANTFGDGLSASSAVVAGDALVRLVQSEGREVDLSLEQRALSDFALRGVTVLQRATAWNVTHGALSASAGEPFMAWAAHPPAGGFNSEARVMWAGESAPRAVFRHVRDVSIQVLAAASDATRGWVLLKLDGFALFGRCVDRAAP